MFLNNACLDMPFPAPGRLTPKPDDAAAAEAIPLCRPGKAAAAADFPFLRHPAAARMKADWTSQLMPAGHAPGNRIAGDKSGSHQPDRLCLAELRGVSRLEAKGGGRREGQDTDSQQEQGERESMESE